METPISAKTVVDTLLLEKAVPATVELKITGDHASVTRAVGHLARRGLKPVAKSPGPVETEKKGGEKEEGPPKEAKDAAEPEVPAEKEGAGMEESKQVVYRLLGVIPEGGPKK